MGSGSGPAGIERGPARGATAPTIRFVLGYCVGVIVRLWAFTYRVVVVAPPGFSGVGPAVCCFWHGQQMALLGARRRARGASVLVSRSRDGDLQAGVMTALGFRVIRGSSSRGGAVALAASIRALRDKGAVLFAVDGPRGPRHMAKPGAAHASSASGAPLVAVASAAERRLVLTRTWDGFEIPLPFSRVAVVVGEPLAASGADVELLGRSICRCREFAESLLTKGLPAARLEEPAR